MCFWTGLECSWALSRKLSIVSAGFFAKRLQSHANDFGIKSMQLHCKCARDVHRLRSNLCHLSSMDQVHQRSERFYRRLGRSGRTFFASIFQQWSPHFPEVYASFPDWYCCFSQTIHFMNRTEEKRYCFTPLQNEQLVWEKYWFLKGAMACLPVCVLWVYHGCCTVPRARWSVISCSDIVFELPFYLVRTWNSSDCGLHLGGRISDRAEHPDIGFASGWLGASFGMFALHCSLWSNKHLVRLVSLIKLWTNEYAWGLNESGWRLVGLKF